MDEKRQLLLNTCYLELHDDHAGRGGEGQLGTMYLVGVHRDGGSGTHGFGVIIAPHPLQYTITPQFSVLECQAVFYKTGSHGRCLGGFFRVLEIHNLEQGDGSVRIARRDVLVGLTVYRDSIVTEMIIDLEQERMFIGQLYLEGCRRRGDKRKARETG